ncbi:aldehyde dehydrogenase family protein [Halodesulfovibrio aestuarii]|uniref:aldehyde dehydrogenase family protein n=1 Tax=Halodesulfovibrio aestuarii TaxID=126333 RepID=UPI003521E5E9
MIIDNDLLSIQQARILAENAYVAQQQLADFSQEKLDSIVDNIAEDLEQHTREFAMMSAEETEYGNWQHKLKKNNFVCGFSRRAFHGMRCVGVVAEDLDKQTMDIGVPIGVIAALCPATSPVSTTIYKALIAIKSGNAIVFSPHPRARKTMGKVIDFMINTGRNHGLPDGALSYLHTVSSSGTRELMQHRHVALILNTGVPGMLQAAQESGKTLIYGGAGNVPAFIERTADVEQAVRDIITSKTFDNGVVAAAEQAIVVDGCIAAEVKRAFEANGAYFMSEDEARSVGELLFLPANTLNHDCIGRTAVAVAEKAGFQVPAGTQVLVAERSYIAEFDIYSREKLCPVLSFYIEPDWMHACEKCIELLLSERCGHTLVIHSRDESVIKLFALKKPVGRVLVNTPAVFGGMGATTNLFPSMTLGSGSAGKGYTSDNISPKNLIYVRKVGYGVRDIESANANILFGASDENVPRAVPNSFQSDSLNEVRRILQETIAEVLAADSGHKN